jgi:putative tricarboxylic transport membrane protein
MCKGEGSSLVWMGLGVLICIGSLRLSLGSFQNPGPGFLPFVAGSVLGILSAIDHLQRRRAPAAPPEGKQALWTNAGGVKKIILASLALLGYGVGLNYLGFLISTFVFLAFLLGIVERQGWGFVILESLLGSGISYLIFEICLQAELPRGIFL